MKLYAVARPVWKMASGPAASWLVQVTPISCCQRTTTSAETTWPLIGIAVVVVAVVVPVVNASDTIGSTKNPSRGVIHPALSFPVIAFVVGSPAVDEPRVRAW